MTIVIDSVYSKIFSISVIDSPTSKRMKGAIPLITNTNSSTSVSVIVGIIGTVASMAHFTPYSIQSSISSATNLLRYIGVFTKVLPHTHILIQKGI